MGHQYGSLNNATLKRLPNFLRLSRKEPILETCITRDCSEGKVNKAEKFILELIYPPNVRPKKKRLNRRLHSKTERTKSLYIGTEPYFELIFPQ